MTLPTVKGTEGVIIVQADPYLIQTAGASTIQQGPIVAWNFDQPRSKGLIIAAGATNGIAIKDVTGLAAGAVHVDIWFSEANF